MSKFLTQSKTFLPMVMHKSTVETIQRLEKYPSFSTAQHQELPKQEIEKQDAPKQETSKQEMPKLEMSKQEIAKPEILKQEIPKQEVSKQEIPKQEMPKKEMSKLLPSKQELLKLQPPRQDHLLKQITSASKENLKIVLHQSPGIPPVNSFKAQDVFKVPVTDKKCSVPAKRPESLTVVAVDSKNQKTMLRALLMDVVQVQRWLMVMLSAGQMWLRSRAQDYQVASGAGVLRVDQPKTKEREPVLLSVAQKKTDTKSKQDQKSEEKLATKSNVWEVVQENSPAWQDSISKKLGEWQKVAEEKLAK